jgi:glycerophosphoryl diester phosphodiesterase
MRIKYRHLLILLPVSVVLLTALKRPPSQPLHPYFSAGEFLVAAHRGGDLLGPEGTLDIFRRAVEMGVDVLEMDVRLSADGALVIFHDSRVDRTTNGEGRVDSLTLEQLQSLDAGYRWRGDGDSYPYRGRGLRIPTLEDVFRVFPRQRLMVEIKSRDARISRSLCQTVHAHSAQERITVAAFSGEAIDVFRAACPEVATAASFGEATWYWLLHQIRLDGLYSPDFQVFQVPEHRRWLTVVDRRFVERAHVRNLPVQVWTVNRREDMQRLLDFGVDSIITGRPDALLELLRDRELR